MWVPAQVYGFQHVLVLSQFTSVFSLLLSVLWIIETGYPVQTTTEYPISTYIRTETYIHRYVHIPINIYVYISIYTNILKLITTTR